MKRFIMVKFFFKSMNLQIFGYLLHVDSIQQCSF